MKAFANVFIREISWRNYSLAIERKLWLWLAPLLLSGLADCSVTHAAVRPSGLRVETHLGHWFSICSRSSNGLHGQERTRADWLERTRSPWKPTDTRLVLTQHLELSSSLRHHIVSSLSLFIYSVAPLISQSTRSYAYSYKQTHTHQCTY